MNAKELALSKLNASTKTLGLYIYGISIGMDFKDLARIMMSDVSKVINEVLSDDVFSGKDGYSSVNEKLFKYFDEGPVSFLLKYDVHRDSKGNPIESPFLVLSRTFERMTDFKDENGNKLPFAKALVEYARSNLHLSEKLALFESLRSNYRTQSVEGKELYNLLIDFVEDYILLGHVIGLNEGIYSDIKVLAGGAAEMRILGQLFGLNQGLKNKSDELLRQINIIERAVYNHTGNLEDLIDLTKFAFDKLYRNEYIAKYEEVKHSFNILDAVAKVPHFMGYVLTLATATKEASNAFKFRSVRNLSLRLAEELGYKRENNIIRGIQNFIGDYLRKNWMRSKEVTFIVPKGNRAFNKRGNMYELAEDTPIQLGTDWGDATFRVWMENEIIPKLKRGEIKPGTKYEKVSNNKFILDLSNDLLTNTVSKNPTIIYTLPINMLPRTDLERTIFNRYKAEFKKLTGDDSIRGLGYLYEYTTNNEDGTKNTRISDPIPLVDLFTYYAMIANNWKLGEKSLVPILEDFLNSGIIKEFHDYETDIDKSGYTLDLNNIEFNDILPYVAPFESPYSSYAKYIQYRNPSTRKYQQMRRLSREEADINFDGPDNFGGFNIEDLGRIKNYEFVGDKVDTNYFPTGRVESSTRTFNFNFQFGPTKVEYDIETGKIIKLDVNNGTLKETGIPELTHIPTKKDNKVKKIDITLLESIINNKLNPCE